MTREEAFNRIDAIIEKHEVDDVYVTITNFKDYDALRTARELLKQEIGHWSRKTKVDAYDLAGVKTWGIKCQCDRCTFTTTVVEDFGYYTYCPNCGAKMSEKPTDSESEE